MTGFSLLGAGEGPANRIDGYADLRAYAAIGDGRTVALIALDGSIDWFPAPTLPTPPAFAAIVDAPHGGRIELRPVDDYTVTRRYLSGTNVLQTTFTTAAGRVRVTDALSPGWRDGCPGPSSRAGSTGCVAPLHCAGRSHPERCSAPQRPGSSTRCRVR